MLFDTVVFILTLYKRLQVGKTPWNSLFYLMIRDGTMYFGFLVVLYSMDIVNFLVFGDVVQLATLTNVVASTLISRLMLNIRDTKGSGELTATTNFTPLIFAEANGARSHM
ncbi:hypothetical protein QCA50_013724 [Cerrena zonata]|uniref:Uncharacterized protein n=1 Tax=Cerrena zonata TaxID=2478898 RepID=A0AAW0G0G2_9APHY